MSRIEVPGQVPAEGGATGLPKVAIVTPIHGDWEATERYLESVEALVYPNLEVVIVDDGSTDGSAGLIAERFPDVIVVAGDGSLWWAASTNAGAEVALRRGADFLFTCNNDVILDPGVVGSSVACAQQIPGALVGAVVYHEDDRDRVWFSGARLSSDSGDISHDTDVPTDPVRAKNVQVLTGMGMLIPKEVFEELEGFDQDAFPHYLADCDFSLRAAERGHRLVVAPGSKIYNDVTSAWSVRGFERGSLGFLFSMLFSMRSAYWILGRVRFYRRHWGPRWAMALVRAYRGWFKTYAGPLVKRRLLSLARWRPGR